jgi:hypothetical protein
VSYYLRASGTASDGSPTFATAGDTANEALAQSRIESAWKCELHRFAELSPIDWYATRHGRVVAFVELKSRSHPVGKFPTVFLNLRKWTSLMLAQVGHGAPALFAVQWTNALRWVPVASIDASKMTIGGTMRVVKSRGDIEPVILVPVETMREVPA